MLGWEFPPFLNGGLGVACHGIVSGLAPHAVVRLIVPKAEKIPTSENLKLLGLNGRSLKALYSQKKIQEYSLDASVNLQYVDVELTGYERLDRSIDLQEERQTFLVEKVWYEEELLRPKGVFQIKDLYGDDLIDRVVEFGELAAELAMEQAFDVIHAHDWMCFLAGLRLKSMSSKPLVLHVHSLEYDRGGADSRGWTYELERHAMKEADGIIAVSSYTARIIQDHYGIPPEKIRTVHNGIFPQNTYRVSDPFQGDLVLYLGRLTGQKGPEYFYEVAKHLLKDGRNIRFVIAGKGHLIQTLMDRAQEDGIGDSFRFTGFLEPDRVKELLAMTNVYVMPSVSEPFGLSALEAAQMGVPCVISRQSGVKEVLTGAITVDYWETEKMADSIGQLLDDATLHRQVVAAQKKDLIHISWEATAKKINSIYREFIPSDL